jgi:uncharacterized protein (DUF2249 family)
VPRPASDHQEIIDIDVSGLEPPEPMERIFARLSQLQAGQLLRVRHRREPFPIYPMLAQAGFDHCCVRTGAESFLIYIWPKSTPIDEAFCRSDAAAEAR